MTAMAPRLMASLHFPSGTLAVSRMIATSGLASLNNLSALIPSISGVIKSMMTAFELRTLNLLSF